MTDLLIPASGNRGPAPNPGEPLLEVIRQPLYSAMAFDAAAIPNEVRAFQYQIGDTVAGAGAGAISATLWHTNMEVAGALATPKVFEVFGIRHVVSNISAAGTTGEGQPATAGDPTLLEDVQRYFHGTHFALHVGTKDYATGPAFMFPGNCGLNGVTAATIYDTAAVEQTLIQAVQGMGQYMSLGQYTVLIPPQQAFHTKTRATQGTPPTFAAARLVWVMLEGRLGREAQ